MFNGFLTKFYNFQALHNQKPENKLYSLLYSNNLEKQVTQKRANPFVKGLNKCFERKVFVINVNFETQNIFIY